MMLQRQNQRQHQTYNQRIERNIPERQIEYMYTEDEINNFPESDGDLNISIKGLPKFCRSIIYDGSISMEAKVLFMKKFVLYYLESEDLRIITDGWFFLFVNKEYIGIYKNEGTAISKGLNEFESGSDVHIVPMYPGLIYEYKETSSLSIGTRFTVKDEGTNNKYKGIQHTSYYFDISFGLTENNNINPLILPCKYNADTGATLIHVPWVEYLDLDTLKYNNYPFDKNNNIIKNENKRRDDLLNMNTLKIIEYRKDSEAEGISNIVVNKTLCFCRKGTNIIVNNELTGEILTMTASVLTIKENSDNFNLFSLNKRIVYERINDDPLMGLNALHLFDINIKQIFPDMHTMTLS